MIEVCFTEEEFEVVIDVISGKDIQISIIDVYGEEVLAGVLKSLETASKPMLYTSENKQRVKE